MFAVIFEVEPKPGRFDDYLAIAQRLRPEIERIDGFILNERFKSGARQGRILSLSLWRNEKALIRWRTLGLHHAAQERGRNEIFADYRLRVGEITADSALARDAFAEERRDETETGEAKAATLTELPTGEGSPAPDDAAARLRLPGDGLVSRECFIGITDPKKLLLAAFWRERTAAETWQPASMPGLRHRVVRIVRDYGLFDRREAPQYYPPVPRSG